MLLLTFSFNFFSTFAFSNAELAKNPSFKVFLFNTKDNKNLSSFVKTNQVHKNDLIIFKDKNDDDEIKYDYLIYNEKHDNFEPKFKFESMSELINDLFRVSSK